MYIPNKYTQSVVKPDLIQTIEAANSKNAADLNCVRIGKILEFFPENLTVKVELVNKKLIGLDKEGSQILEEYPPIFAKVGYCNPFETFPLTQGMECVLLFSDREIESWFINGEVNQQKYSRMHDLTDAIALVGIRSIPNMIQILADCLHLFYGQSDIQIKSADLNLNGTAIKATSKTEILLDAPIVKTTGNLEVATGQSGVIPCGSVTLTFSNGILTGIS